MGRVPWVFDWPKERGFASGTISKFVSIRFAEHNDARFGIARDRKGARLRNIVAMQRTARRRSQVRSAKQILMADGNTVKFSLVIA